MKNIKDNKNKKNIKHVINLIITIIAVVFFLVMIITLFSFNKTDSREVFPIINISFYTVMSESMNPVFDTDDIIVLKAIKKGSVPPDYEIGDIITYQSFDISNLGINITHRIVGKTDDGRYLTKGDNNTTNDPLPVYQSQILGKYLFKINGAKRFVYFIRSIYGFILFIAAPALFLIILEAVNFVTLSKKLKREQFENFKKEMEKIELEKVLIEKEKLENYRLTEKLMKIKDLLPKDFFNKNDLDEQQIINNKINDIYNKLENDDYNFKYLDNLKKNE
jgi:signal peptidase